MSRQVRNETTTPPPSRVAVPVPAPSAEPRVRSAFGGEFDVPAGYLNTPTVGIPPQSTADAVVDVVQRWSRGGVRAADFDEPCAAARTAFAQIVDVAPQAVAMGASASALVGLVAASVADGARVLCAQGEFTSLTFPFAAQAPRGVQMQEVALADLPSRAGELRAGDVVAVSCVQSADGAVADLAALRDAVADSGVTVVLDATQSAGWLDADTSWADAVVASGYKWLLSPRGAAWMALSPRLADQVVPHAANWSAADDPWGAVYGLPLRLASSARRFDTSPAWFCHLGASVSLPWLAGLDRSLVHAHVTGLADALRAERGLEPAGSAIVAVDLPGARGDDGALDHAVVGAAVERLERAGVMASARAGRVRVGFALYNDANDLDRVVQALG